MDQSSKKRSLMRFLGTIRVFKCFGKMLYKPFHVIHFSIRSDEFIYVLAVLEERCIWATDYGWELPSRPVNPSNPRPDCTSNSSNRIYPTCPFRNGDFEFFISAGKNGDTAYYKEFEFNANVDPKWNHNKGPAVMTLSFPRPYNDLHGRIVYWLNNNTNEALKKMQYAVKTSGPINDPQSQGKLQSWTVEVKVPIKYIIENVSNAEWPKEGTLWRVAFSRVVYHLRRSSAQNGYFEPFYKFDIERLQAHKERNFVWPPTYMYDIHMPDMWGGMVFTKNLPHQRLRKSKLRSPLERVWGPYGTLSRY